MPQRRQKTFRHDFNSDLKFLRKSLRLKWGSLETGGKSTLQFAWCWKIHSRTRGFAQKKCRLHCTLWSVTVQVFKAFWKALHLITDNLCEFYYTTLALMSSRRRTNQSALFKSAIAEKIEENYLPDCALKLFKIPTENGLTKFVLKLRIALKRGLNCILWNLGCSSLNVYFPALKVSPFLSTGFLNKFWTGI